MHNIDGALLTTALKEIEEGCKALLAAPRCELSIIPRAQGAYLIYNKKNEIIYVGKGGSLKRRICNDHQGGDEKMSRSTFRRKVNKVYGIPAGRHVKEWVCENCSFAFVTIPDPDLCAAVEALTILVLRRQGCKLLNS